MTETSASDEMTANEWMVELESFAHVELLWRSTCEREEILQWARTLDAGSYRLFNLYVEQGQFGRGNVKLDHNPFVIAFCTNDDAIAVQFRLAFPHIFEEQLQLR